MSDGGMGGWMPTTSLTVAFAVRRFLSEGNAEAALGILIVEILRGRFASLTGALAGVTPVSENSLRLLLSDRTSDSSAMRIAYELAGLPYRLYPFFATCIDLTQEVLRARKASPTPQVSSFILDKALTTSAVQELNLEESFVGQIRYHVDPTAQATPAAQTTPAVQPPPDK